VIIGQTISHYRIVEKLGEGGMGVVYKAEDTKLERTVALKFLAAHLLNEDEAKERFLREAKAAAGISHANICHVHEIGEEGGKTFISMAFLEGASLEDRIAKGPLALKDALDIARQIAEGLEAAHEKGIVHRDIKPANIMVDAKGHATVMDFGLARLTEASRLTKVGSAVGTVAYMSPEQAQGMDVDGRTDLWALGCVLYEMVSGQRPFQGQYDQALLYEIVHEEPVALTGLRTGVPIELELLTSKCLAKDADDRYQSAKEIVVDLRTLAEKLKSGRSTILRSAHLTAGVSAAMPAGLAVSPAETLPPDAVVMKRSSKRALQALAAVLAVALLGLAYAYVAVPESERPLRRFSFSHEGLSFANISPDGRYIVFAAQSDGPYSLWLRALGSETARRLAGTEGLRLTRDGDGMVGAWSPDGQAIVFGAADQLKRVSIDGGEPARLCELPVTGQYAFLGASWSPDGERIVFSSGRDLWEVPARGGEPRILLEESGLAFLVPRFLPEDGGSRCLVYTVWDGGYELEVMDLNTGDRTRLGPGWGAAYAPSGHLLYSQTLQGGLTATPFSLETLTAVGEAFPVDETGIIPSLSRDGVLVYTDTGVPRIVSGQMVVRNRSGEVLRAVGGQITGGDAPAVSPDGRRVAINAQDDIWVYDLDRDLGTRLTSSEGAERHPAWLASGRELSYTLDPTGLAAQVADGSVEAKVLLETPARLFFFDWSFDDRFLAYVAGDPAGGEGGIWYRERAADGSLSEPVSFLRTPSTERMPRFSPNGRYLAYRSDESGRPEVYVRPFPQGAGKWQVSTNGGSQPRWAADGTELFYVVGSTLMAVSVSAEDSFTLERPQRLFESTDLLSPQFSTRYDVFRDGQRFLTIAPAADVAGDAAPKSVRIVENWYEEFRDREQ